MKRIDALRKARRILADPKRFCKGASAKDAEGNDVPPKDPSAKKFDAFGAIARVGGSYFVMECIFDAALHLYDTDAVDVNDSHDGRRKILRCYDYAIRELKK